MNYCIRCGHPSGHASTFCISCGVPLATDEEQEWAPVPPGPESGTAGRSWEQPGEGRMPGVGPLEQTGNVRIIGGAGGEVSADHGSPAFPGPGAPAAEPEAGREPGEDTAAWLPGFMPAAPGPLPVPQTMPMSMSAPAPASAPAPTLALPLRQPARPVEDERPRPRRPLVLPPPGDGGEYGPADPEPYQRPPGGGGDPPGWLKIAVVLVAIAGGLGAWYYLGRPQAHPSARPASSGARTPGTPRAQASPGRSGRPPGRPRPAGTPRGSQPVALGPGVAGQSAAAGVAAFLTQYFAAINDHDYQAFSSLFEPRASPVQSDGAFRSGYRTSRDAGARLVALGRAAGGEWAASLTFDSQQDPAVSATHTGCTTWGVTFYLVPVGTSYLIGPPPPGYQASALPCA